MKKKPSAMQSAVVYQLSYQANWEQVIMWVNYKPIDVELDGD